MASMDLIQTLIDYDISMNRQVWESIAQISTEQFLQEDEYSRGSIRNLMVHLASTERRWLAGLKNRPDVGHLDFADFPDHLTGRDMFETVAKDLHDYVATLNEADLRAKVDNMPSSCEEVLMHLVNHGTDHRATVLQRLYSLGAPTFEQDFISWLWARERGE
jgi:uncharacterized damage-inducible protein DinB